MIGKGETAEETLHTYRNGLLIKYNVIIDWL